MSEIMVPGTDIEVGMRREVIEYRTAWTPTADSRWSFVDASGHEHYYEHGYPTLDYMVDREHWCQGDEGFMAHDPHTAIDEAHYECKICREVITPATEPPGTPHYVAGATSATISGTRSDGVWVRAAVPGRVETSIMSDAEAAQRLLDGIDESCVIEWRGQQ